MGVVGAGSGDVGPLIILIISFCLNLLNCSVLAIELKSVVCHTYEHPFDEQPDLVHGAKFQGKS